MKLQIIECKTELRVLDLSTIISSIEPVNSHKFIDKNLYENTFEAIYFQEFFRREKFINLEGIEDFIEITSFINQRFAFIEISSKIFLVVFEPSRQTKYLYEYLNKILGLKLSYSTKKFKLDDIVENLSKFENLDILKARFNEISLNKNSKCSLEITSSKNALTDFYNTFGDIYYDLAKIKVSFFYATKITLEINKNGAVIVSKNLLNEREFIPFFIRQILLNNIGRERRHHLSL